MEREGRKERERGDIYIEQPGPRVQAATSATTVHRRVQEGEIIDEARRVYKRHWPGLPDLIWQFAPPLVTGHLNDTGPAAFTVCVCIQN